MMLGFKGSARLGGIAIVAGCVAGLLAAGRLSALLPPVGAILGPIAAGAVVSPAQAAETPLDLKWAQLVPAAPAKPPKAFFSGRPSTDATAPVLPETGPDARWMSAPNATSKASAPPAVVESLNGKRVQIGGYVVALDFEATKVTAFLLVPFVGACIHVPPPPPNQIIYVETAQGFEVKSQFEPVYVTGTLTTTASFTGLADAGYTLKAERVDPRKD